MRLGWSRAILGLVLPAHSLVEKITAHRSGIYRHVIKSAAEMQRSSVKEDWSFATTWSFAGRKVPSAVWGILSTTVRELDASKGGFGIASQEVN